MAKHKEESAAELLLEKITDKFHGGDSSSSDSDDEKSSGTSAAVAAADAVNAKIYCLFEREKPIHTVLGGGKHMHQVRWLASEGDVLSNSSNLRNNLCAAADLFLWRDKKISAATLGLATAIWIFFELMEYHLLTLICHGLILSLAIIFLWSNASTFINKSRPHIPEVSIPEDLVLNIAHSLRYEINWVLAALREIALGRDLKKFLIAIAGLWFLSIVGNCFNFLTLFYIAFVTLHTVPILYEKYEGKVDAFAEKAEIEFKKHYAVIHAKYSSKIPMGPLKDKKIQ